MILSLHRPFFPILVLGCASYRSVTSWRKDPYKVQTQFHGTRLGKIPGLMSSCPVNDSSRQGFKQLGILIGSIFPLFSYKSRRGHIHNVIMAGGLNPRPPALNDSQVVMLYIVSYI